MRVIGIQRRGPGPRPKLIAALRLLAALALVTGAPGCGSGGGGSPPPPARRTVSELTVRVSELETGIAEYCERRSSNSATAADRRVAAADLRELIALARRDPKAPLGSATAPTVRDALADTSTVIEADCRDPALERRAVRALAALR